MTASTSERLRLRLHDQSLLHNLAFVGGEWVQGVSGATFEVTDPATGDVVSDLARLGALETRQAIDAANAALPAWQGLLASERSGILRCWADLMRDNADDLAAILTAEQGKPWAEARGEVIYAAGFFDWFAEEGRRVNGDVIPSASHDNRIVVLKQPIGVTGGITPWNLPAAMVTRKAAPALAAGNTMVLKPASLTPLISLAIADLGQRAGIPAGVFNVVCGDTQGIGDELTGNPIVRKIGFTGSTEIGKLLLEKASHQVKRVSLELGGNSPFIVFDDADVNVAVDGIVASKFRNAGQLCTSANRILVQEGILDSFLDVLTARTERLSVGHGFDEGIDIGPLVDDRAVEKVERQAQDLLDRGGKVLAGGRRHALGHSFYEPTVMTGLEPGSLMWSEETFGPLAGVMSFGTEEEVVALANDTEYGLLSFIFSYNLGRVWRVAEALEAGMVAVNNGRVSGEMAPFGGIKESGIGREGSKYGLEDWLDIKYVNMGGILHD